MSALSSACASRATSSLLDARKHAPVPVAAHRAPALLVRPRGARDLLGRARSASRDEALRALEQFGAGVAQRVAVVAAASASESAAATTTVSGPLTSEDGGPGIRSLTNDTFWPFVREEAGDKLVVIDFYTQWCGPCKLIYPKLVELSLQLEPRGVLFAKCDCNADFKERGKELGIRVAPTFHLYRNGEKVAEMTGAHVERLLALVEEQLSGDDTVVPV